jgi:tetratricopeptide (TPR) repeat protein
VRADGDRDPDGAASAFARAIATGGAEESLFAGHACALARLGRADAALGAIDRGLVLHARSAALRAHRGLYLHALRRYDEELSTLNAAVAVDPQSAEAHFQLGLGYARREQYGDSLAELQQAVLLSGGAPRFVSWFGRIAADAGRPSDARDALAALRRRAATHYVPPSLIDAVAYHLSARQG